MTTQSLSELGLAALSYVQEWQVPIFPCVPGKKKPLTKNGFRDAIKDPDQIRKWWGKTPDANIAMPTGKASGYFVVDLDVDKEKGVDGIAT